MTGVENYFWPRKNLVFHSFYKGSAGRFSLGASGEGENENYRLEGRREGMRDREKVMGRRGEPKERCRS